MKRLQISGRSWTNILIFIDLTSFSCVSFQHLFFLLLIQFLLHIFVCS